MAPTAAPARRAEREERLASIYELYAPSLRRRCLGLTRDPVAAEDLMQEVFVRFLARVSPAADMNVHGYLLRMARNIWLNELRAERGHPVQQIDEARVADDRLEHDPVRMLLLGEQRTLVRSSTAGLATRQRRALALRELEDRSYEEIGEELGIGANAVAQVVWRARRQLRRALRWSQVDAGRLPETCRAMLDDISDRLDSAEGRGSPELEMHMTGCRACRSTLASFQEAGSRLRGALPLVPLAAMAGRAATALRLGAETHLGIGAAMVTVAVVAVGGGGAVISQAGAGSSHARTPTSSAPVRTIAGTTSLSIPVARPVTFVSSDRRTRRHGAAAAGAALRLVRTAKPGSLRRRHAPRGVRPVATPSAARPAPPGTSPPIAPAHRNPVGDAPRGPKQKDQQAKSVPVKAVTGPVKHAEKTAGHEAAKRVRATARADTQARKRSTIAEKRAGKAVNEPSKAAGTPAPATAKADRPAKAGMPVKAQRGKAASAGVPTAPPASSPPAAAAPEQTPTAAVSADPQGPGHGKKQGAAPPPEPITPAADPPVAPDPATAGPVAIVPEVSSGGAPASSKGKHGDAGSSPDAP